MLNHTSADIAAELGRRYSPEGFIRQYSEEARTPVVLGEGVIEERYGDFSAVTYPLVIGNQISDNLYVIGMAGAYSNSPEIFSLSFSGKHPLASGSPIVQLVAQKMDGHFVRGNDLWLDIVFPGIEFLSQQQQPRMQPQLQPKRRVLVATATPLSKAIVRDLEELVKNF